MPGGFRRDEVLEIGHMGGEVPVPSIPVRMRHGNDEERHSCLLLRSTTGEEIS
jgi:hypothetical protein